MLAIGFKFERGRYHATMWRSNINEGFVDWPPSPWRILRALISSWKINHREIADNSVQSVITTLLSSAVTFYLPPATQSHTRHYVPTKKVDDATGKVRKALMIDSFVVVDKNATMYAIWADVTLDDAQARVLETLLGSLRYLGRAESMCHAFLTKPTVVANCRPLGATRLDKVDSVPREGTAHPTVGQNQEITKVLVPSADATLEDLCSRTFELHKENKAYPPHTSLVEYVRPLGSLSAVPRAVAAPNNVRITVVRYRIDERVCPLLTETMRIGDAFKRAAMSCYKKTNGVGSKSANLSGMSADGGYLRADHSHTFYLATDDEGDRRLDHVTVMSATPFGRGELDALAAVRSVRHDGKNLRVTYVQRGGIEDFDLPLFGTGQRWVSSTPYVPNRHVKVRGRGDARRVIDGPEEQVAREIAVRGMGTARVKRLPVRTRIPPRGGFLPVQYKTWRKIGLPGFGAYAMSIEFDMPVTGPIALGHGSHFGLGLFVPDPRGGSGGGKGAGSKRGDPR